LMMAWMDEAAIRDTLDTGQVCYYSRSRQKLWRKGESSGQTQTLKNFRFDCDSDTILLLVDQKGVACHTGRRSCFYEEITDKGMRVVADVLKTPEELYGKK
ncbi:MAG: phosphoribosyl-AMP cyclohydrolase, partial [Kordiimonadaceae bacterium]|nr:phosphoribosyl-AMP cyclohydrolase [Kordiimonadaceae bacterium]